MPTVFVCHRGSDAARAGQLGTELRGTGHEVWLDEWRIEVGDSIVERMNEGLEGSAYLVLCYSADGVMSPWISREWLAALARQLDGHGVRILPVRLSGGSPPAILADVKYADLATDWDTGMAELHRAIR